VTSWVLVPCLERLFVEFDHIAPARATVSDGKVGDTAHAQTSSDHNPDETGTVPIHDADKINEVHAIDVTATLNESDLTMERVVQFLLGRCRSGAERRLRYIIYARRIWSASSGWSQKAYTGPSAHIEHAHFSASYESALEASTASWHLEDIPVALTPDDKTWLSNEMDAAAGRAAQNLRRSQKPGWSDTAAHNLAADAANAAAGKHVLDYWGDRAAENPAAE